MKRLKILLVSVTTVLLTPFAQASPVDMTPIITYLLSDTTPEEIISPITYTPDAGRLLGSQCSQCHGTNGVSTNEWDSIAGEDNLLDEIYQDEEPIMDAQAHGYTEYEIILMGNWLKTLTPNN
jgi:mono/diheme cytochrome c family protein